MGNTNTTCQMSNYSKRNIRVYIREKALAMDAFITSESGADEEKSLSASPADKKFPFKKDEACIRVLASQTQDIPLGAQNFLSVFVEDEDDEKVCAKKIILNMALSAPVTVLLYDV
ncbi:unnamed protein product [Xyrichtys novacula]|uniref:Unnamed protein product n=1 Tax=Xyrichtys novacula TaxID=13765 RepID=A0AAV1GAC5_XYRNO|nr:unnamed protein product [Xyrichtys novacula]